MSSTHRAFIQAIICAVAVSIAAWSVLTLRYAGAEDMPALYDAHTPDPVVAADHAQPPAPAPVATSPPTVPDPESSTVEFLRVVETVAKTSWPSAAVLVLFALVSVGRRHSARLREGSTGIATATALALLTIVTGSIALGVPLGQAIGSGLVALLTGKALATPAPPAKAVQ